MIHLHFPSRTTVGLPLPADKSGARPKIDFVAVLIDVRSRAR